MFQKQIRYINVCPLQGNWTCECTNTTSILAKHARDSYICDLVNQYPELQTRYDLKSNFGYQATKHREGIAKYGISQFHRKTYRTCENKNVNPVKSKDTK